MQMLKEEGGKTSSKRVMGVVMLLTMLVLFSYKEFKSLEIVNVETFIAFLITSGTLLGITIINPYK